MNGMTATAQRMTREEPSSYDLAASYTALVAHWFDRTTAEDIAQELSIDAEQCERFQAALDSGDVCRVGAYVMGVRQQLAERYAAAFGEAA